MVLATCLAIALPELWHSYWIRIETLVLYFSSAPEAVLSARVSSWTLLSHFALEHPEHLLLGIGYKTLPYSSVVGERVIADNTYLSLLIETGLLGLGSFLALSFEMLRRSLRVAQNGVGIQALLAIIFFCFWIGEMVHWPPATSSRTGECCLFTSGCWVRHSPGSAGAAMLVSVSPRIPAEEIRVGPRDI